MKTVELSVPDMSCGHCVATVQSALTAVAGVEGVEVSLPAKKATVRADDAVTRELLAEIIPHL